ncbi:MULTISPECIES: ketopantoate reductase family protein [Microbacterium]|uniref:ketopantoate reductase family protein n=1 Tax=Microbacterium TaxID=33882 RepID=UPI00277D85FF|nr:MULTISPECIES: 2-dehydropantoate 2-reductase N-terminal domain-containing protein [Microbacterium]MDQ1085104.1 2-dehydropantoate 2-reductase [Microbacterium sp. SORGH_AS_0344]MDQ1169619.1 2-dehydropantoate 2-reductase [Microbacterium proteolyticum]
MSADAVGGRRAPGVVSAGGRRIIVGAGALGALLAAQWTGAGLPAVLVARGAARDVIDERGVLVRRPHGDERIAVDVVGSIDEAEPAPGDTVVLAVKSQDAEQALAALAWRPLVSGGVVADLPVVTLQNGLATEDIALRRFARVVGVSVAIAASHLRPGEVVAPSWPTLGTARVGAVTGAAAELEPRVSDDLASAGFAASVVADIAATKRRKLLANLRNVVEVFDVDDAVRDAATASVRDEAAALFDCLGLDVAPAEAGFVPVEQVPGHVPGRLSTWQSLERGASVESDFLVGELVLLARRAGVEVPLAEAVQRDLGALAARGGRPGAAPLPSALAAAVRGGSVATPSAPAAALAGATT